MRDPHRIEQDHSDRAPLDREIERLVVRVGDDLLVCQGLAGGPRAPKESLSSPCRDRSAERHELERAGPVFRRMPTEVGWLLVDAYYR